METITEAARPTRAAIRATHVHLRLLAEDDLEMTLAWRNRDEVRRWFKQSDILSLESHRAWFTQHQLVDDAFMFVVEDIATGAPVGQVSIYAIDREIGEAEVGRFIAAPGVSGKGLIRDAISALVHFAFSELSLQRVYLEVLADNARAIRLYESLGFVKHGERNGLVMMELRAG
jgi:RimJ/RimL family protein N-acetyltransferase